MVRKSNSYEKFVNILIEGVSAENRCPHFGLDGSEPYCGKGYQEGNKIEIGRRMACDSASLQLWCLDKERCDKCIFYKGESFRAERSEII